MGLDREKILIIEGNETRGKSMSVVLSEVGGYSAVHVQHLKEAVKHIKTEAYDMIITNTSVEKRQDGFRLAQMVLLRQMVKKNPLITMVSTEGSRAKSGLSN